MGRCRILYCANDPVPFPKGAGVRIEATVRALVKAGAQLTLLTPACAKPPGFDQKLPGIDHQIVEVGPGSDPFLDRALRFRRGVERVLVQPGWDIFWFRSPWEGWACQRLGLAIPTVYEAHGFPSIELIHHFPGLRQEPEFLARLAFEEQWLLDHARCLLTPSQTGRAFLATRGVALERIHVVPNTVTDEAFLGPNSTREGATRVPLPRGKAPKGSSHSGLLQETTGGAAGDGVTRLVYTGTLAPWQGLDTLLEALLHLKGRLEVQLECVGTRKGRWTRPLRSLAQQLRVRNMVSFEGPFGAAELRRYLAGCHIGVVPLPADARNTQQGCCPIKLVEFMAAGLPILSTRLPVVEELVEHNVSAWLVRPNSPWSLAQGITRLTKDPELCRRLGEAAQQRASQHLHRDRFEAQLSGILQELTAEL